MSIKDWESFGRYSAHNSMTVRDYLAAQAMPIVLQQTKSLEPGDSYMLYVAKLSYRMADAMLEAR